LPREKFLLFNFEKNFPKKDFGPVRPLKVQANTIHDARGGGGGRNTLPVQFPAKGLIDRLSLVCMVMRVSSSDADISQEIAEVCPSVQVDLDGRFAPASVE
jgi:hypothetical protein